MTDPTYYTGSDDRNFDPTPEIEPCLDCEGTGQIDRTGDGYSWHCPTCEGVGAVYAVPTPDEAPEPLPDAYRRGLVDGLLIGGIALLLVAIVAWRCVVLS
jgi:RecJ-like exonuclease